MPILKIPPFSSLVLKRVKVSGLLSFGVRGIDLSMGKLNVLIGPNGAGKSNFLEVLGLRQAAPNSLARPIRRSGGVGEWLWSGGTEEAVVEVVVANPGRADLRHLFCFRESGRRFEVVDERIEEGNDSSFEYRYQRGSPGLNDRDKGIRVLEKEHVSPEESILSQWKDQARFPALSVLEMTYRRIQLYRNWCFGPAAAIRREQSTHDRNDFLEEGGANLALILSTFIGEEKRKLVQWLHKAYDGIFSGKIQLWVIETGGRAVSSSKLSDGTLRFLALLAILLHPRPPALVAIDEPELGLHPDLIHLVAQLLRTASERMQIVVTTHSRELIDALGEEPESVVICEKEDGESRFERLDAKRMKGWLKRYSLGELWSKGELGGNRW